MEHTFDIEVGRANEEIDDADCLNEGDVVIARIAEELAMAIRCLGATKICERGWKECRKGKVGTGVGLRAQSGTDENESEHANTCPRCVTNFIFFSLVETLRDFNAIIS